MLIVYLGQHIGRVFGIRVRGPYKRRVRLGFAFHGVIYESDPRIGSAIGSRLLHLLECRIKLARRQQPHAVANRAKSCV